MQDYIRAQTSIAAAREERIRQEGSQETSSEKKTVAEEAGEALNRLNLNLSAQQRLKLSESYALMKGKEFSSHAY